jgi:hypothetical protein
MVKCALAALLLLSVVGCHRAEKTTAADVDKVVRDTLQEVRSKYLVVIQVRLEGPELPTPEELQVRDAIETRIESEHMGRIVRSEAVPGHYDITVEVDSTAESVPRIREVLRDANVLRHASVRVAESPK